MSLKSFWRDRGIVVVSWVAAALGIRIPPSIVVSVSQELIALFGLLLAGALPTMILTATILRAGAFSPKRVGQYADALERQLSFWFGLFIWALLACVAIMVAKALWDPKFPYEAVLAYPAFKTLAAGQVTLEWSRLANGLLGYTAAQVIWRLFPMLAGLRSLLRLNSLIAKEEAAKNAASELEPGRKLVGDVKPPDGHGSYVGD